MQYVLIKSIEFSDLRGEMIFLPAGVIITVDPQTLIASFAGHHFDVMRSEISAIC
jgi:hypothetical protein